MRVSPIRSLIFLSLSILFMACSENSADFGDDIIGTPDAGVYNTVALPSTTSEWKSTRDSLSGLHRYRDSLARNGSIQGELVVGSWEDETSIAYFTSYDTIILDSSYTNDSSIIVNPDTLISYKRALYLAWGTLKDKDLDSNVWGNYDPKISVDTVTTELAFKAHTSRNDIATSFASPIHYSLNLHTGNYTADSSYMDTSSFTYINSGVVKGEDSSVAIRLHSFNAAFEAGDTAFIRKNSVTEISPRTQTTTQDSIYWITDSTLDTLSDSSLSDYTDTVTNTIDFLIDWMDVIDTTVFDTIEIKTTIIEDTPGVINHYVDSLWGIVLDTITLETDSTPLEIHFDTISAVHIQKSVAISSDTLFTISDTLFYPLGELRKIDTVLIESASIEDEFDSLLTDSIIVNSTGEVNRLIQYDHIYYREVRKSTIDPVEELLSTMSDTLNLYMTLENSDDALFHLNSPVIRIMAHSYDTTVEDGITAISDDVDTSYAYFGRYSMTTTSPTFIPSTTPMTSGGLEIFSEIKLNLDTLWDVTRDSSYKFVSYAKVELPINTAETKIPAYQDSTISLRGIVLTEQKSPSEILKTYGDSTDSRYQETNVVTITDSVAELEITSNVHDILREYKLFRKDSATPNTYLYLWIDGAHMGKVTWLPTDSINLTYILQQAN